MNWHLTIRKCQRCKDGQQKPCKCGEAATVCSNRGRLHFCRKCYLKLGRDKAYAKLKADPKAWRKYVEYQKAAYKRRGGRKKYKTTCIVCGDTWEARRPNRRFCSPSCANGGHFHFSWNGGKYINEDGYVLLWAPNHPAAHGGKYVLEHRLVMERHLGRLLRRDESIHHRNGIKSDNRIENLEVMSPSKHSRLHAALRLAKRADNN